MLQSPSEWDPFHEACHGPNGSPMDSGGQFKAQNY